MTASGSAGLTHTVSSWAWTWAVPSAGTPLPPPGAWNEDGKGPSIWDTFGHTPGKVHLDVPGDVAVHHYHRFREDIALMRGLGVDSDRFSMSWPRILPEGTGTVNRPGLDFYHRLVDD